MISEIIDNIYIGNWHDARDFSNLFITFTVAFDSPFKSPQGFYYKIEDSKNASYDELLSAIKSLYRIRITNKTNKILVHCVAGLSRSAVVVAGYLMLRYKMEAYESINFIKDRRTIIHPNLDLVDKLVKSKELNYG